MHFEITAEVIQEYKMSSSMKDYAYNTARTAYSLHSESLHEICKYIRVKMDGKYG